MVRRPKSAGESFDDAATMESNLRQDRGRHARALSTLPDATRHGDRQRGASGRYQLLCVSRARGRILLTCEHVARVQPMHYRFLGSDDVFEHPGLGTRRGIPSTRRSHRLAIRHGPPARTPRRLSLTSVLICATLRPIAQISSSSAASRAKIAATIRCSSSSGNRRRSTDQQTPQEAADEIRFEDAEGFSGSLV